MSKTPDRFPGEREDEGYWHEPGTVRPTQNGESRYVTGEGFVFFEEGIEKTLGAGSGITEAQHEILDTLTHGLTETSYDETLYSGSQVTDIITWDSVSKLKKVREENYSYSGSKVSQVVTKQYDGTGTLKTTVTEVYTYSGSRVTSVTRTRS